ncbi:MmgE/PrpD family protein [Chloroflexota bacterium]
MSKYVSSSQEDPMVALCRMVVNTEYEDLPSNVVDYAKRSILDTIGVIIGGSAMEGIPEIVAFVKDKGGKLSSLLPFYGVRLPASEAAFAIGPMARAMDLGDVHPIGGHNSEYTIPAMLALASKATGKEFITAYVLGQEVLIRVALAYRAAGRGGLGYPIFGVVAAVGKLLGLKQEELENAEGIGSLMTQPDVGNLFRPATLMVRVHHGFTCQDGVNACLLAQRGITGPRKEVLLAPNGFLGLARWETDPASLTRGLGEEWQMMGTMMKRYTSRGPTQPAIEGIIGLMKEYNIKAEDIAKIDIDSSSADWISLSVSKEIQFNPQTVPECQFSLPYIVATAAYDGDVFLDSFTPEARERHKVRDLMTRITIKHDPSLPDHGAIVNVTVNNGKKYSKECAYPKGHPKFPLTEQELVEKFKKCVPYSAYKLSDNVVNSLLETILNLERVKNIENSLLVPLTPTNA